MAAPMDAGAQRIASALDIASIAASTTASLIEVDGEPVATFQTTCANSGAVNQDPTASAVQRAEKLVGVPDVDEKDFSSNQDIQPHIQSETAQASSIPSTASSLARPQGAHNTTTSGGQVAAHLSPVSSSFSIPSTTNDQPSGADANQQIPATAVPEIAKAPQTRAESVATPPQETASGEASVATTSANLALNAILQAVPQQPEVPFQMAMASVTPKSDSDSKPEKAVKATRASSSTTEASSAPEASVPDFSRLKAAIASGMKQMVAAKPVLGHDVASSIPAISVPAKPDMPKDLKADRKNTGIAETQPEKADASHSDSTQPQGAQPDSEKTSKTQTNAEQSAPSAATADSKSAAAVNPLAAPAPSLNRAAQGDAGAGVLTASAAKSQRQIPVTTEPAPSMMGISNASLIERFRQSELSFGMRTGEFGHIEVRTVVSRHEVSARISVERSELGRALTSELPVLQRKLNDLDISSTKITVLDQSAAMQSGSERRSPRQEPQPPAHTHESSPGKELKHIAVADSVMTTSEGLSIRI